nr:reverse transcriptase domain-containing protein [Tanacetum cinerariifolium]
MLFDSGIDKSFVSSTFSALFDVAPSNLDTSYAVELADGRFSKTNVILRGCTLGLLGHTFDIDLMPVELGSFDIIIGMDWLAKYHALIVWDEKVVRIHCGYEILIIRAGSESRSPMLNKENYVPWSSRLLRYAKSRPNVKLIHNSILNGPYVRKMIPEPGDANRVITVTETFHLQTDDELSDKELKMIKADDQAIQTILLGLPEDIYAAVDSCE